MSKEKAIDLTQEEKEKAHNMLRGSIKYYRELKKRLGDMFTKKQQAWLDELEEYAKENNIEI